MLVQRDGGLCDELGINVDDPRNGVDVKAVLEQSLHKIIDQFRMRIVGSGRETAYAAQAQMVFLLPPRESSRLQNIEDRVTKEHSDIEEVLRVIEGELRESFERTDLVIRSDDFPSGLSLIDPRRDPFEVFRTRNKA